MSLFQHTILKKQILAGSGKIRKAYKVYVACFHNPAEVKAVIELKDYKTTDLKQVETQAFGYKNNRGGF
jgi:hypothetical protein